MKNHEFTGELTGQVLSRLANEKLKARTSFIISLNLKNILEVSRIYNEKHTGLINKYAVVTPKKDAKGEVIMKPDGTPETEFTHPLDSAGKPIVDRVVLSDAKAFAKELDELLNVDVDVKIMKLKTKQLDGVELTPLEMGSISWMIDFDEDEDE